MIYLTVVSYFLLSIALTYVLLQFIRFSVMVFKATSDKYTNILYNPDNFDEIVLRINKSLKSITMNGNRNKYQFITLMEELVYMNFQPKKDMPDISNGFTIVYRRALETKTVLMISILMVVIFHASLSFKDLTVNLVFTVNYYYLLIISTAFLLCFAAICFRVFYKKNSLALYSMLSFALEYKELKTIYDKVYNNNNVFDRQEFIEELDDETINFLTQVNKFNSTKINMFSELTAQNRLEMAFILTLLAYKTNDYFKHFSPNDQKCGDNDTGQLISKPPLVINSKEKHSSIYMNLNSKHIKIVNSFLKNIGLNPSEILNSLEPDTRKYFGNILVNLLTNSTLFNK